MIDEWEVCSLSSEINSFYFPSYRFKSASKQKARFEWSLFKLFKNPNKSELSFEVLFKRKNFPLM